MMRTPIYRFPTHEKSPGKREEKLLATLYDKKRYVIHYRNVFITVPALQRLIVLQFVQSPWLREYIQLNTNFRTLAKYEFEKNLFQLINNAVFGKTMENMRNHVNVRLVTSWDRRYGIEAMIAKLNFHIRGVFSENIRMYEYVYLGHIRRVCTNSITSI